MLHLYVHPESPQQRLISQAVDILKKGGVIVYPNDTAYAFACALGEKDAMQRISQLRQLEKNHQFTLLCRDLSEIATYAKVSNEHYRVLKANTPAPITYILEATKEVPKRLMHPKKKTIGIRVPTNPVSQLLLETMDEPILTSTLILPEQKEALIPMDDPYEVSIQLDNQIDALIDIGMTPRQLSTIVDLTGDNIEVIRHGIGDTSQFC